MSYPHFITSIKNILTLSRASQDTMAEKKSDTEKSLHNHPLPAYGNGTALSTYIKPQHRRPHDPSVTFEEYHYYALKTRVEEQDLESTKTSWREIVLRKKTPAHEDGQEQPVQDPSEIDFSHRLEITDEEWTNASRAFRTASWGACKWTREHLSWC